MLLGDWIQKERKKKFPSQHTFAAYIGISQATISLWERNKIIPSVTQLATIAKSFGLSLKEIPYEEFENLDREGSEVKFDFTNLNFNNNNFETPDGKKFQLKGVIGVDVTSGELKVFK